MDERMARIVAMGTRQRLSRRGLVGRTAGVATGSALLLSLGVTPWSARAQDDSTPSAAGSEPAFDDPLDVLNYALTLELLENAFYRDGVGLFDLGTDGFGFSVNEQLSVIGAHEAAQLNVADAVVHDIGPVDPAFLDEHTAHAGASRRGGDLARVVGLHAADRHQRVAALRERVGDEVLQLAQLVAAVCEAAVAVVALGPERSSAQVRGQPLEPVHRGGAEQQRIAREGVKAHVSPLLNRVVARAGVRPV